MKLFNFIRDVDASGVSGTGKVAQGVIFDSGRVALTWLTHLSSVAIYDSIDVVESIHGHEGQTRIEIYYDDKKAAKGHTEPPVVDNERTHP